MNSESHQPARIQPFYAMENPGETIVLIKDQEATLSQEYVIIQGTLTIKQEWWPMKNYWEFRSPELSIRRQELKIGLVVQFSSQALQASGHIWMSHQDVIMGELDEGVIVGSEHKVDRVTFHLLDYPPIQVPNYVYSEESVIADVIVEQEWSEVSLEHGPWVVKIQQCPDYNKLEMDCVFEPRSVLSGVGVISKTDSSQFKKKDVTHILEALRIFLSFAFSQWTPPVLVVGSNEVAARSFQIWNNYQLNFRSDYEGCFDTRHGHHLEAAFPGFMEAWSKESWKEPIELAIGWLIEATSFAGGVDGAIALAQIPLEMLAWLVFVEDGEIVDGNEFEKLSAASKLQMLLAHCGISFDVPVGLESLTKLSTEQIKQSKKITTGPQILTTVRNSIIHPHEKNRAMLKGWETEYSLKLEDIKTDVHRLFQHYITLVMLRLFDYMGEYADRTSFDGLRIPRPVPWSISGGRVTT